MTRRSKAQAEVFSVQQLLALKKTPTTWLFPGPDPPDVVARLDGKCLGIEVTEYAPDTRRKGSRRKKELDALYQLRKWLHIGRAKHPELDRVNGHLCFGERRANGGRGPGVLPDKREFPRFTRQLYEFASRRLAQLTEDRTSFDQFDANHYDLLDRCLRRLDLKRVNCFIFWHVIASVVTDKQWGEAVADDSLAAVVEKKAERLRRLSRDPDRVWAYDELWLLITTGDRYAPTFPVAASELRSFGRLTDALATLPDLCPRVVLYNYYLGGVMEWQRDGGWQETVSDDMFQGRWPEG